jgi:hypothetical protein
VGAEVDNKMGSDRVRLNVGGKPFVTSRTTLANAGRGSMLAAMIDENWDLVSELVSEEIFIDRNPSYFSVLLDLLRTGELHIPSGMSEKALYREAEFYGITDRVRHARKGPLDGNRLECVASISGRATGMEQPLGHHQMEAAVLHMGVWFMFITGLWRNRFL